MLVPLKSLGAKLRFYFKNIAVFTDIKSSRYCFKLASKEQIFLLRKNFHDIF